MGNAIQFMFTFIETMCVNQMMKLEHVNVWSMFRASDPLIDSTDQQHGKS